MGVMAVALETVDAADPDAPNRTIRRQRRVDPLRALGLTDREWAAAERLRANHDLAMGCREDDPGAVKVDCSPVGGDGYTAAMLDAIAAHRGAIQAMGLVVSPVAIGVVLLWMPLDTVARELRLRRQTVGERLRTGLAALSEYYG